MFYKKIKIIKIAKILVLCKLETTFILKITSDKTQLVWLNLCHTT